MEPDLPALEITEGVHKGAVIRLDTADMLVIGASDDCDVILADAGVSSHHCVLTRQRDQLFLRTMDGMLTVNGKEQKPGETILIPTNVPIAIGSAVFEIVSTTSVAVLSDIAGPVNIDMPPPETAPPSRLAAAMRQLQLLRRRPLGVTVIVVAVVASMLAVRAISLAHGGLSAGANVDADHSAAVASVAPRSGTAIAHDVAEVLRLSGIACEAHYNGDGTVTVKGHLGESQALAAIVNSRAIREIVGLKRVMAINLDQSGRSVQGVDGSRIVSVVASADPYVVTADGSRYYVGASLPQGGRLAGVKQGEVLVERDGRTEHWRIADPEHGSGDFRPTTNLR